MMEQTIHFLLDAPPLLDGMIAAGSKLFLATRDGKLTCWQAPSHDPP